MGEIPQHGGPDELKNLYRVSNCLVVSVLFMEILTLESFRFFTKKGVKLAAHDKKWAKCLSDYQLPAPLKAKVLYDGPASTCHISSWKILIPVSVTKEGECRRQPINVCADNCKDDADCPGQAKCCANDCGMSCSNLIDITTTTLTPYPTESSTPYLPNRREYWV